MATQSYLVDEEPVYYGIENYGSNYGQQVANQVNIQTNNDNHFLGHCPILPRSMLY